MNSSSPLQSSSDPQIELNEVSQPKFVIGQIKQANGKIYDVCVIGIKDHTELDSKVQATLFANVTKLVNAHKEKNDHITKITQTDIQFHNKTSQKSEDFIKTYASADLQQTALSKAHREMFETLITVNKLAMKILNSANLSHSAASSDQDPIKDFLDRTYQEVPNMPKEPLPSTKQAYPNQNFVIGNFEASNCVVESLPQSTGGSDNWALATAAFHWILSSQENQKKFIKQINDSKLDSRVTNPLILSIENLPQNNKKQQDLFLQTPKVLLSMTLYLKNAAYLRAQDQTKQSSGSDSSGTFDDEEDTLKELCSLESTNLSEISLKRIADILPFSFQVYSSDSNGPTAIVYSPTPTAASAATIPEPDFQIIREKIQDNGALSSAAAQPPQYIYHLVVLDYDNPFDLF